MPLTSGSRIGPYEIVASIGAGGMGEVYRAKDSKLKREVAIKVLPHDVATDPERLARFQREAEVLASLNHPHIAHVYGIEENALVMELVEGEDLSQRITRGPIPIDEALPIARQIAEALEAAHDAGIIHRDLKPANIKVRADGTVKVLDFGLARTSGATSATGATGATVTSPAMTMRGVILGTAAYMAPEQAKGKLVDHRADVWAFGCVLYEMLTGTRTFRGDDTSDTIAEVLKSNADYTALPPSTPPSIRTLLRRCLEKDPHKRAPHIAIARLAIEDAMTAGGERVDLSSSPLPRATRRSAWIALSAAAALIAAASGYWAVTERTVDRPELTYRSTLVIDENIDPRAPSQRFAISPDGRRFVYAAADVAGARIRLWLRNLDSLTSQALPGTENATGPFWSPDSRSVAFFANNELKRIDIGGGPPVTITSGSATNLTGATGAIGLGVVQGMPGTWSEDGVIVFSSGRELVRVSAAGGATEALTALAAGETVHDFPHFLPDGRHFLFAAYQRLASAGTFVGSLDGTAPVRLMNDSSNAQYANGRLLFVRGSSVMAQPFDANTFALSGEARPLVESVLPNLTTRPASAYSISRGGTLVYQAALGVGGERLVWSTRAGVQTMIEDAPIVYRDLALSPDGSRLAFTPLGERGQSDIWVLNLARGVRTRVTFSGAVQSGVWAPDGNTIIFNLAGDRPALLRKAVDGSSAEQPVPGDAQAKLPNDWSPDGRMLLYDAFSMNSSNDIWALPIDGAGKPVPIATSRFSERWGQFSPDGRWIAYTSDETGPRQVYVTRLGASARWQITAAGGSYPRWSHDGRELYFYTPNNKISAVRITVVRDAIEWGPVSALFDARPPSGFGRYFYDVTPDGRFLLSTPASTNTSTLLTLLVNWPALLQQEP